MKIQEAIDLINAFNSKKILIQVNEFIREEGRVYFLILTDNECSGFEFKQKLIRVEVTKNLVDYVIRCKELSDMDKAAGKLYAYLLVNGMIVDGADPQK